MRTYNDIKIAAAFIFSQEITQQSKNRVENLSREIAAFFNSRSTCFMYYSEDPVNCRRSLLKAALFEDYRIRGIDYLLWINSIDDIDLFSIKKIVDRAENERLDITASIGNGQCLTGESRPEYRFLLIHMECIRQYNEKFSEEEWCNSSLSPDEAFITQLERIGYTLDSLSFRPAAFETNPMEPFRLAGGVDFVNIAPSFSPSRENRILRVIDSLKMLLSCKSVALYGAGSVARTLLPIIEDKVRYVIDIDPELDGKEFCGLPVKKPELLKDNMEGIDTIVITPIGREREIRKSLEEILGDNSDKVRIIALNEAVEKPLPSQKERETGNIEIENSALHRENPELIKNTTRELTQRGVLYVGFPCNIKCVFCYYLSAPFKNEWRTLEECKRDAGLYRKEFKNRRVDITGGEPTIYSHIMELLDYCNEIGLVPSMITNMQVLADSEKVKEFKKHGVYDFLCSIHALGDSYDIITGKQGAWKNLIGAVENLGAYEIKWRVNCTMTSINRTQLKRIAQLAYENGARVINFINFNPFREWSDRMDIDFQSRHSEIAPYLKEALDYCDEVGLEANVRFFPFCKMKGHEEKCYNYSQLSYDSHEWDFCSWLSDKTRNPTRKFPSSLFRFVEKEEDFHLFIAHRIRKLGFIKGPACRFCAVSYLCDGFLKQYAGRFGMDEMEPYEGEVIRDPVEFIKSQKKVVDF